MKPKQKFIAAAVQCSPVFLDVKKTIDKIESLVKEAHKNKAELIAFPEAIIPAYPYWIWTDSPFKWEKEFGKTFFENSLEIESLHTKRLCKIAKSYKSYLIIGVSEKTGGTLYNSQLFISEKGNLDGIHRKLIPTFAERSVWGRGDGSTLNTYKTKFGVIGGLICGEHHMPLARYALLLEGEEIHISSFPGFSFKRAILPYIGDIAVRNHAIEGQVFVINSTSYLSQGLLDQMFDTDVQKSFFEKKSGGFSSIINPFGSYVSGPLRDKEGILYGEINKDEIYSAKRYIDVTGHYSRPDVLRLHLNKSQQKNLYTG